MIDDKLRERVHLWLEKKPRKSARPHHCFSQMGLWVRDEDEWEIVRHGAFEDLLAAALKKLDKIETRYPAFSFHKPRFVFVARLLYGRALHCCEDGVTLLAALYELLDKIRESEK